MLNFMEVMSMKRTPSRNISRSAPSTPPWVLRTQPYMGGSSITLTRFNSSPFASTVGSRLGYLMTLFFSSLLMEFFSLI